MSGQSKRGAKFPTRNFFHSLVSNPPPHTRKRLNVKALRPHRGCKITPPHKQQNSPNPIFLPTHIENNLQNCHEVCIFMGMKAEEVRVGNHVLLDGDVKEITVHDFAYNGLRRLRPIPITQEWVERYGFNSWGTKAGISIIKTANGGFRVEVDTGWHTEDGTTMEHIQYVHQLQNLYFALTGEELIDVTQAL